MEDVSGVEAGRPDFSCHKAHFGLFAGPFGFLIIVMQSANFGTEVPIIRLNVGKVPSVEREKGIKNGEICLSDFWAKTTSNGLPNTCVRAHCLHVGAVARAMAGSLPAAVQLLLPEGYACLIAAHDIGKISPGFQLKCAAWRDRWQQLLGLAAEGHETRHAWTSQKFLASCQKKPPRWMMALGGHHGRYLCADTVPTQMPFGQKSSGSGIFDQCRNELLQLLVTEFGPLPSEEKVPKGARLHWFTGAMIFCDWVGSNTTWFTSDPALQCRDNAAIRAREALGDIGVHAHAVHPQLSFADLFGFDNPRPLQTALVEAMDAPGLYIVEAPMGEGKTEAALAGAYRRWHEGGERGLYFALPTQLTSNRIRDRVENFFCRVVADESALALVHGNAWLTENRIRPFDPQPTGGHGQEPDNASEANSWFADSRRAMLAPFGVGTIDQALMAVVPVKYSALRLFGLGGKVVVIDEVHSYDPFTAALVDRLVQWLLELGGTVVVLSATLTAARRASLVEAAGATEEGAPTDYPLLTKVACGSPEATHIRIDGTPPLAREVRIVMMPATDEDWMNEVVAAAETGACVLVIRNTVDLARESYSALSACCRDFGIKFGLVHSRFTQADRDSNETQWTRLLGKDAAHRPRKGAVLVGTQVLEQSLDIDADFLVTDLAPTELILQRIGRLHRHARPRPIGFEGPRCVILRPQVNWQSDRVEILEALKPHRFIYPPFALYMADRIWNCRESVALPDDIRRLLEDSASVPGDLPEVVDGLRRELEDAVSKMRGTAWMNGVFKSLPTDDKEGGQTRWNMKPSAHLVVLERTPLQQGNRIELAFPCGTKRSLHEGRFDFPLARLLNLHAVRVPAYVVRGLHSRQPRWLVEHMRDAVLAVRDETNRLVPWPEDDGSREFFYSAETGLRFSRSPRIETRDPNEEEETWY